MPLCFVLDFKNQSFLQSPFLLCCSLVDTDLIGGLLSVLVLCLNLVGELYIQNSISL